MKLLVLIVVVCCGSTNGPRGYSDSLRCHSNLTVAALCDWWGEGINRCAGLESRDRVYSRYLEPSLSSASVGNLGVEAGLGLAGGSTVGWTLGEEEHSVTIIT